MAKSPAPPASRLLNRQIGRRLAEFRDIRRFSQDNLASLLGIERDRLSKYERGVRDLPLAMIVKLDLIGCDIRWLISGRRANDARPSLESVQ